jgi:pimeloyl-ACP methyl ester carboxylesterase
LPDTTPYAQIAVPTLLIAGDRDRLRMSGYASPVARQIPQGHAVVLPGCGHCPNIEQPERVFGYLADFLG